MIIHNRRTYHTIRGLEQHPFTAKQGYKKILASIERLLFDWDDAYPDVVWKFEVYPATAAYTTITVALMCGNDETKAMWDRVSFNLIWNLGKQYLAEEIDGVLFVSSQEQWND